MAKTYEPIATYTVPSAQASYTFSSIPGTYTDLVLIHAGKANAAQDVYIRFNGDTGGNYSRTLLFGNGSTAGSNRDVNFTSLNFNYQDGTEGIAIANILNYANTTTNKTVLSRYSLSTVAASAIAGLWRNTAAINSLTVGCAGTLSTGSVLTLYGIKAA
jgi:hypothetical protein